MVSSEYQPDNRTYREREDALVAQQASMTLSEHQPGPRTGEDGGTSRATTESQASPIQHEQAESKQASTGQPPSQPQQTDPSSRANAKFHTERNTVKNKSEQIIYRHEGDDAKHVENSSIDNSKQSIGATFVVPAPETTRRSSCFCS